MPNIRYIIRRINKSIKDTGLNTILKRANEELEYDSYGEPISGSPTFIEIPVRIAVDTDRRDHELTPIGSMPDEKREYIHVYFQGDVDVRIGDKIVYPAGTDQEWLIGNIFPAQIKDVTIFTEARAFRDASV